jgi:hypothetical protein
MPTAIGVKGRVGVCVHSTRPGTHLVVSGGRSARPSICARNSSRKRAQSARSSSLTKSPGRSGPRAGGGWGCSVGPEIISPPGCGKVDKSGFVLSADASALGAVSRRRRAGLYAVGRGVRPPERGECPTKSAQRAGTHPRERRRANPSGPGGEPTPSHNASARSPAPSSRYASSRGQTT